MERRAFLQLLCAGIGMASVALLIFCKIGIIGPRLRGWGAPDTAIVPQAAKRLDCLASTELVRSVKMKSWRKGIGAADLTEVLKCFDSGFPETHSEAAEAGVAIR
jgi:hypothetical protein